MNKFFIKTLDVTSVIYGERMFIDGDTLFVYDGENLKGMYKVEAVILAYSTEGK